MEAGNLASAGSAQGLMQSRSNESIAQDLQRQRIDEQARQDSIKPFDEYLKLKRQRDEDEKEEISKFINFKEPVMPKDEQERLSEASEIVKMIKDKANPKDIEQAKINFLSKDLQRISEYKRAVEDIKTAASKHNEYDIIANPFAPTNKGDYKTVFGDDRYSREQVIKPKDYDIVEWVSKKTPKYLVEVANGINKKTIKEGTSFASEEERMVWQQANGVIGQMIDGITPQSKQLLKETTKEVLANDPELEYYPEELDHVVKQVAKDKILSIWDAKSTQTKIDNNVPIGGNGFQINTNIGGGGIETTDGTFIKRESAMPEDEDYNRSWKAENEAYYQRWKEKNPTIELRKGDEESRKAFKEATQKPSKNNPELTIEQWNKEQHDIKLKKAKKGLNAVSFTPKNKDNWFEATTTDGKSRKVIPKTIYLNQQGEIQEIEGYNYDEETKEKQDFEVFSVNAKNEANKNSFLGKYPTVIDGIKKSANIDVVMPNKVVIEGKAKVGSVGGTSKPNKKEYKLSELTVDFINGLGEGEIIVVDGVKRVKQGGKLKKVKQ